MVALVILKATCWAGFRLKARHLAVYVGGGGRAKGGAVRQFTNTIAVHADRKNNKN